MEWSEIARRFRSNTRSSTRRFRIVSSGLCSNFVEKHPRQLFSRIERNRTLVRPVQQFCERAVMSGDVMERRCLRGLPHVLIRSLYRRLHWRNASSQGCVYNSRRSQGVRFTASIKPDRVKRNVLCVPSTPDKPCAASFRPSHQTKSGAAVALIARALWDEQSGLGNVSQRVLSFLLRSFRTYTEAGE